QVTTRSFLSRLSRGTSANRALNNCKRLRRTSIKNSASSPPRSPSVFLRPPPAAALSFFPPPAIPGVGTSGGFTFILEDRSGGDVQFLAKNLATFMDAARKRPEIAQLSTTFLPSVPEKFVDVNRDKVLKQGVVLNDVYKTIQAFMGGYFINYFNRFGRQWQVYIEAESEDRASAENVGRF